MKKTKLFTSIAALALVLGLGACEEIEETLSPDESESTSQPSESESTPSEPETTTPSEGGEESYTHTGPEEGNYFLGFNLNEVDYYIDGGILGTYTYEGTYTSDITKAVPVTVKEAEGDDAYHLSFEDGEKTKYVTTVISGQGYTNLDYSETESLIYWNSTYECWGDESREHFLCYYSNTQYNYECLYCSDIQYVSTSPIAKLYEIPEGWAPYEEPEGAITIDAQYIIDNFARDNSDGYSDVYAMGSGSGNTANDAESKGYDVIGGVTMDFGTFDIKWIDGDTATKVWSGNQIRMYKNGGGFQVTPHEGYQISSLSFDDSDAKLQNTALYTIANGVEAALTLGTDYSIASDYKSLTTLEEFSTTDTLEFKITTSSSNTVYLANLVILCEAI